MRKPITVLLVDDNPTFLRIASRYLEEPNDITVVGLANGGLEGLAKAKELEPMVILLDLAMEDMSGLQVLPLLRERNPDVVIIALTMLDTDGYRTAALDAGADGFVAKASMGSELIAAIRAHNNSLEKKSRA